MSKIDLDKFVCSLYEYGRMYEHFEDTIPLALKDQGLMIKDGKIGEIKSELKVGDWIVRKDGKPFGQNSSHASQIINVTVNEKNGKYIYWLSDHEYICDYIGDFRKWTIEDAKDGDVLATLDYIIIFKKLLPKDGGASYCHYDFGTGNPQFIWLEDKNWYFGKEAIIHPATKEQRDFLFQKMKEAGYKWDAKKKELINVIDEPFDDLELTLYDYLSSDTCGEIPPMQMRRTVKARAREIREKLK